MINLKKKGPYEYEVVLENKAKVIPRIYADEEMVQTLAKEQDGNNSSLKQIQNISMLPGLLGVVVLSDVHPGYGAPIGTTTITDLKEGVISFSGTGFDINCGVHGLVAPLSAKEVSLKKKELAEQLFKDVPAGLGIRGKFVLTKSEMDEVLEQGAGFAVKKGYGKKRDLQFMEEKGCEKKADVNAVTDKAKERALDQIGTLGSGNHYCEVQKIEKVFDEKGAKVFGLEEGGTFISIHCGSRALGHQIGTDYLEILDGAVKKYGIKIAERDLVCAPIQSEEGQKYFGAIKAGSNAAFANRFVIGTLVKRSFAKVFGIGEDEVKTFYDVGHNTAKIESHYVGHVLDGNNEVADL